MSLLQDRLAKSLYKYQNKLQSINVKVKGTKITAILLDVIEDKFGNNQMTIHQFWDVECMISFPENEIPVSLTSTQDYQSSESTQVLHMTDLIPITCFFRNDDIAQLNIKKGMILLYPLKMADGNMQVMEFQITDCVAKGNPNSGILYSEFTIALITSFALRESQEYQNILEEVKETCKW